MWNRLGEAHQSQERFGKFQGMQSSVSAPISERQIENRATPTPQDLDRIRYERIWEEPLSMLDLAAVEPILIMR